MKKSIIASVALALLSVPAWADMSNNQALGQCLTAQKYSQENFNSFNFEAAAKCHQKTVAANVQKEVVAINEFLEKNPHYRGDGSGWYKSVEVYSTR